MIDDADIPEIAEAVRLSRISKVWKDPKKAQNWGEWGWVLFLLTILVVGTLFFAGNGFFLSHDQEDDYVKKTLSIMDCKALKETLLSLEDDSLGYNKFSSDIQTQITGRC